MILFLTGCVEPPVASTCWVQPSSFQVNAPPPARMFMTNNGKLCGYTSMQQFGSGNTSYSYGTLTRPPRNGRVTVRTVNSNPTFYYQPNAGFVGEDSFEAELGPNGSRRTVLVAVRAPDQPTSVVDATVSESPPAQTATPAMIPPLPQPAAQPRSASKVAMFTAADRSEVIAGCQDRVRQSRLVNAVTYCDCIIKGIETQMSDRDVRSMVLSSLERPNDANFYDDFPPLRRIRAACLRAQP